MRAVHRVGRVPVPWARLGHALRSWRDGSGLGVVSVLVGVACVVVVAALSSGMRTETLAAFAEAGAGNFEVRPIFPSPENAVQAPQQPLTHEEVDFVNSLSLVRSAIPVVRSAREYRKGAPSVEVGTGGAWLNGTLRGTEPHWTNFEAGDFIRGRNLTHTEVADAQRVVVLSATLAEGLFGSADPRGKQVRIASQAWRGSVGSSWWVSLPRQRPASLKLPATLLWFPSPSWSALATTSSSCRWSPATMLTHRMHGSKWRMPSGYAAGGHRPRTQASSSSGENRTRRSSTASRWCSKRCS